MRVFVGKVTLSIVERLVCGGLIVIPFLVLGGSDVGNYHFSNHCGSLRLALLLTYGRGRVELTYFMIIFIIIIIIISISDPC